MVRNMPAQTSLPGWPGDPTLLIRPRLIALWAKDTTYP